MRGHITHAHLSFPYVEFFNNRDQVGDSNGRGDFVQLSRSIKSTKCPFDSEFSPSHTHNIHANYSFLIDPSVSWYIIWIKQTVDWTPHYAFLFFSGHAGSLNCEVLVRWTTSWYDQRALVFWQYWWVKVTLKCEEELCVPWYSLNNDLDVFFFYQTRMI